MTPTLTNEEIAFRLRQHAAKLASRGENLYRVRAYRQAALTVMGLNQPLAELGREGLLRIKGIWESLAETLGQFAKTGEWKPRTP